MRLIPRQRNEHRAKTPARVAISQAEITADLNYPAPRRQEERPGRDSARSATR